MTSNSRPAQMTNQRTLTSIAGIAASLTVAAGLTSAAVCPPPANLLALLTPPQLVSQLSHSSSEPAATIASSQPRVAALGRLEPLGEVVHIAAPAFIRNERVQTVRVRNGQAVREGDVIAIMDSVPRLTAALDEAQQRVGVCRAQLERVLSGAKQGEIDAQRATVSKTKEELDGRLKEMVSIGKRLKSEQALADSEHQRYAKLYAEGAISAAELDSRRTRLETATARLNEADSERERVKRTIGEAIIEAEAGLARVKEVRPVDVQVARAELANAVAASARIRTDLELATIRAPRNGHILKVWAHEGEAPGEKGIADLGQTNSMVAVAEVFESDVKAIRKGQHAAIRGSAFDGILRGTVYEIGWRVTRQNTYSTDPGTNFDNRVVEVKILLSPESSKRVQSLTDLQVEVQIET